MLIWGKQIKTDVFAHGDRMGLKEKAINKQFNEITLKSLVSNTLQRIHNPNMPYLNVITLLLKEGINGH